MAGQKTPELVLKCKFYAESARFLPELPKTHPCRSMHGHSFAITFAFRGPVDKKLGWVIDYHEVQVKVGATLKRIDHKVLNEIPGLENPTSENIAIWLFNQVRKNFTGSAKLVQVGVQETRDSECYYPDSIV